MKLFKKKKSNAPRRRLVERETNTTPTSSDIFRRNRTLTGTTSNHLGSANTKSDLESPRTHVHHLTTKRQKVFSILVVVIASAVFLWLLVSNFTASVSVSASSSLTMSKPIDSSRYQKVIQEYLNINPMGRLYFLLDQSSMTAYVSNKLPEVSKVVWQGMVGLGKTNFVITMRTPVAGWKIDDKQYYVDSKGVSFELNYFSAPTVQIVDNSGISPQTGTAIASNRFLGFVGRVVALAKASGYTVTQAVLPSGTTRELEVRLKDSNYLVKLSIDRPVGEQVEDMVSAVQYFTSRGQTPNYIDVRVSGKAFYK
jgi:hypothetical protein